MPVVISFTVETDGRLPTGQTLKEAIETVDAATGAAPAYYMINCAHPTHFEQALAEARPGSSGCAACGPTPRRAATPSSTRRADLDDGNPVELGQQYRALRRNFRQFNVLGGCCGTDHRHVEQICFACSDVAGAEAGGIALPRACLCRLT